MQDAVAQHADVFDFEFDLIAVLQEAIVLHPAAVAYQRTLGVPGAEAKATNTLVLKPEAGVWYDITRRVYLNVNAGYMFARPDVEIVTAAGVDKRTARADQFILKVGVVYSIF